MGVKVKKLRGSWYLVINYKGRRKTKKIGSSKDVAREVARKVEAKLALGDMGIFESESEVPRFSDYADRWLKHHVAIKKKAATLRAYTNLMNKHIFPVFGTKPVNSFKSSNVEDFIYGLATSRKNEKPQYTQSTMKLVVACLRSFFSYAKRSGVIAFNPASALGGDVAKSQKSAREVESMTIKESEGLLQAVKTVCSFMYPFFLCALRTGMRRGELIGLKWGDIAFGRDEFDSDRYIMVNRTYGLDGFDTPKSSKPRRVDMSRQLRSVLLELRDARMLSAIMQGKSSIADDLVFQDSDGSRLNPRMIGYRFMEPALSHAGLRRFTPHCLRHTYAVLSLQDGAPLKYVSEQLGHSSIVITANVYGRFQPGVNISYVDRLDRHQETLTQTNANQTQTPETGDCNKSLHNIDTPAFIAANLNPSDITKRYIQSLIKS